MKKQKHEVQKVDIIRDVRTRNGILQRKKSDSVDSRKILGGELWQRQK